MITEENPAGIEGEDRGAYTDTETSNGRETHHRPTGAGEYTDVETEDGHDVRHDDEEPGQYTESDLGSSRAAAEDEEPGKYTDTDPDGRERP